MPALTLARWAAFEADFGPLTIQERLDKLAGMLAFRIAAGRMDKPKPSDYEVRWERPIPWTDDQIAVWLEAESKRQH